MSWDVKGFMAGIALLAAVQVSAQEPVIAASPNHATLAGVVRDSANRPLRGAEVLIPLLKRSVKTGADGRFVLDSVAAGDHEVWIRSLGFVVAQFSWPAKLNTRLEIASVLRPLPNTLDPVVVWAAEEKTMLSKSIVQGIVTDDAGNPIPGAEVALLGAGRTTFTADDGSYVFRHAPAGNLTIRARLLGYSPAVARLRLLEDDDRKVYLKMESLAHLLDEVSVTAQSGFGGPQELAFKELDQRLRFRAPSSRSVVLGAEDLARREAQPLDLALLGLPGAIERGAVTSFGNSDAPKQGIGIPGDVCILENGWRPLKRPLKAYDASQIETLEYYPATPPETEWTHTVGLRMENMPGCGKTPMGGHPAWYVLWFKGAR